MSLDAEGKILRAKIRLGKEQPFFATLLSYMNVKKMDKRMLDHCPTMAVSNKGDLYYAPEFVDKINENELKGVLCHEVLHLALGTMFRKGKREHELWSVTQDIMINNILTIDGFSLPKGGLIPNNNEIDLSKNVGTNLIIKNISKKTSEQIYDEIYKVAPKTKTYMISLGKGDGSEGEGIPRFDDHIYDKEGKEKADGSEGQDEKDWSQKLILASTHAKMIGKFPAGMEEVIGRLVNNKVNWKRLLHKYLTNEVFSDYNWARPSRRSSAIGTYLPAHKKENIQVVIAIDTSGSISQQDLTQFVSEIVHIIKSTSNIKAFVMQCDADLQNELEVRNGDIPKILDMKIRGRGGTSFAPVIEKMKKDKRDIKLLIYLTDGYGSKVERQRLPFDIVWVLTKNGSDELIKDSGKVIKMED